MSNGLPPVPTSAGLKGRTSVTGVHTRSGCARPEVLQPPSDLIDPVGALGLNIQLAKWSKGKSRGHGMGKTNYPTCGVMLGKAIKFVLEEV